MKLWNVPIARSAAVVSAVLAVSANCSVQASPVERAVDVAGVVGTTPFHYGDHTVNAAISTTVETDSYTFAGSAGQTVRAVISGSTSFFGPQMVLREPDGTVLKTVSCSVGGTCSTNLDATLPSTGTYTLNVSDFGSNNTGNYSLHLDQYPTPTNWQGVAYGTTVSTAIGHPSDSDFYAFNGAAGTIVRLAATSLTSFLGMRMEAWDPAGNLIANPSCSVGGTCSTSTELNLSTSGIYRVSISDPGWNNTGDYQFSASCVFGNCPSSIAAVPEPSTYALMLVGVGFVAFSRRRGMKAAD